MAPRVKRIPANGKRRLDRSMIAPSLCKPMSMKLGEGVCAPKPAGYESATARSAGRSLRSLQRVVQRGDLPPAGLLRENQGETGPVSPCKRTLGGVQLRVHVHQSDLVAQQASGLDGVVICAPGVDGPEDRCMTGGDRGPSAEVLAADVDEVGVAGEGGRER